MTFSHVIRNGIAAMGCLLAALPANATPTAITLGPVATTYYYASVYDMEEAPGTIAAPDASEANGQYFGGGLCAIGAFTGCPSLTLGKTAGPLISGGTSSTLPGMISLITPTAAPGTNYILTLQIAEGNSQTVDDWDVVLNGVSIGLTGLTGGSAAVIVQANETYQLSLTDLTEQYEGQTDALDPGVGTVSSTSTLLSLKATATPAPEPAGTSVILCGLSGLIAIRRRRAH
jgi:hypothetical protein